jgi:hypothetical protein
MGAPRPVNEGSKWRLRIDARDGNPHTVHVQLPDRGVLNDSYVRYVAGQLFVEVEELDAVLDGWTPEQLREHLEAQDPEELRAKVFGMRHRSR